MAAKQFTLTNTGAASGTIDTFTFNDPASIGHTANLANLGGGSAVTGNVTGLGYTLGIGASQTFTVDYNDAGAGLGTYSGNIVIGGSGSTSQTITSTISVSSSTTTTTTTTTAAPGPLAWYPAVGSFNVQGSATNPGVSGASAGIALNTDGSITKSRTNSGPTDGPTQFLNPISSAIGYSARFYCDTVSYDFGEGDSTAFGTYCANATYSPADPTWQPLGLAQQVITLSTGPGGLAADLGGTLYIREDANITNVISIPVFMAGTN